MTGFSVVRRRSAPSAKPSAAYLSSFSVARQRLAPSGKPILLLKFRILGASRTSRMSPTILLLVYAVFAVMSTEICCKFVRIIL